MPIPRLVATANKHVTNRLATPVVRRLKTGAVVVHTGRVSGSEYRTPVLVFRHRGGFVIPLTYGVDSDWVKNVQAAGGCRLEYEGELLTLDRAHLVDEDEVEAAFPSVVRLALSLLNVQAYFLLEPT